MADAIESTGAALADLVEALRATNWSSWQTTHRFDPALQAAEATLAHERVRDAAPDLLAALTQLAFMARTSGTPTPELLRACEGAEALIAKTGGAL